MRSPIKKNFTLDGVYTLGVLLFIYKLPLHINDFYIKTTFIYKPPQ